MMLGIWIGGPADGMTKRLAASPPTWAVPARVAAGGHPGDRAVYRRVREMSEVAVVYWYEPGEPTPEDISAALDRILD